MICCWSSLRRSSDPNETFSDCKGDAEVTWAVVIVEDAQKRCCWGDCSTIVVEAVEDSLVLKALFCIFHY